MNGYLATKYKHRSYKFMLMIIEYVRIMLMMMYDQRRLTQIKLANDHYNKIRRLVQHALASQNLKRSFTLIKLYIRSCCIGLCIQLSSPINPVNADNKRHELKIIS